MFNFSLAYYGISIYADARIHNKFSDILKTADILVDEIFAFARAVVTSCNRHLVLVAVVERSVAVVKLQRNLRKAERLSDFCSAAFLFIVADLKSFLSFSKIDIKLGKKMLRFTLPIIPTVVMWTIVTFSDQLFIGNMESDKVFLGKSAAGLYAAATKIPNLISILSTIFFQAWNMSAITENDSPERNSFYKNIYKLYESALFVGAAGLLLLIKPVSSILINDSSYKEYGSVYIYTPLLIIAAVFNCMNDFLFGIYTATNHTKNAFYSTTVTCVVNLIMNTFLIPVIGIQGAALATFLSYLLCYCIRMIDARYYVPFKVDFRRTTENSILLSAMCVIIISKVKLCWVWAAVLFAAILLLNLRRHRPKHI